jgi:hypothetical protein
MKKDNREINCQKTSTSGLIESSVQLKNINAAAKNIDIRLDRKTAGY